MSDYTIQYTPNVYEVNTSDGTAIGVHNGLTTAHGLGGSTISNQTLIDWAEAQAYEMTSVTYNSTYPIIISSAVVKWPDTSAGALTITAYDATFQVETSYTLTHTASGKTVTQAAVTLDANGNITIKPALTVA